MDDDIQLLAQLISYAHEMGATDLHISADLPPDVVVRGQLYALEDVPDCTEAQLQNWASYICGERYPLLAAPGGSTDGVAVVGQVRVRCAFRRQRGGTALTARLLPLEPPKLENLDVPEAIANLTSHPHGLVVVSGPTGAGKSTLLAALVNEVNATQSRHIMTIEDPVEFAHPQQRSRISHREVGLDVDTFGAALRDALRARPNLVVVGEMRDTDTARAALDAASKGQLVLTTSHAGSASEALEGFVGMFPAEEQVATASRLASVFQAVVVQHLVPNVTDTSLVPVREVLLRTDAAVNLIRSRSFGQLYNTMQPTPEAPGMFKLEEDLLARLTAGQITWEQAVATTSNRKHLDALVESARKREGRR